MSLSHHIYSFFAGTYTDGASKGIYHIRFYEKDGTVSVDLAAAAANPSFLCRMDDMLYAGCEYEREAEILVFRVTGSTCRLQRRISLPSCQVCHLSCSRIHRCVFASCYGSGDFYSIDAQSGDILSNVRADAVPGEKPRAHCAVSSGDGRIAACADLGMDRITLYPLYRGAMDEGSAYVYQCPEGSGPRQLVFHPRMDVLYAANECDSTLHVFSISGKPDALRLEQTVPACECEGENYPAALAITADGRYLCLSNRGADSISVFHVEPNGQLVQTGEYSCHGKWPRHILLTGDGRYLVVSNQHSDSIVICPFSDGRIGYPRARVAVPSPSCALEHNNIND